MAGGLPASLNQFFWQTDEGERSPPMASKVANVKIRAGQRVRLESPGGGGWGDPLRRDPQRVARDVRLGYVNAKSAARDYGVVVKDNGEVDESATVALRKGAAA